MHRHETTDRDVLVIVLRKLANTEDLIHVLRGYQSHSQGRSRQTHIIHGHALVLRRLHEPLPRIETLESVSDHNLHTVSSGLGSADSVVAVHPILPRGVLEALARVSRDFVEELYYRYRRADVVGQERDNVHCVLQVVWVVCPLGVVAFLSTEWVVRTYTDRTQLFRHPDKPVIVTCNLAQSVCPLRLQRTTHHFETLSRRGGPR